MVMREIREMEDIPSPIIDSCPEKVVARGYGLLTGIAGQPNSFKLDARAAGFGDFDVVIKGASRAAIEYIEEEEALYKIKYFVELPGTYQIEIKYDMKHIPGSPYTAKVIDANNFDNQSIGKTDDTLTNSAESFSTINESTVSEEDNQSISNGAGKILPIVAVIQTPSGKVIQGTCVQNTTGKVTVNFPREETGTYTITLKHKKSGKILPGSPYEVCVQAKEMPITMTAHGTGLKEAGLDTTNCFTVYGNKGIDVKNVCLLAIGPSPTKLKIFQNDWDSIDVLYEVKRRGIYHFYVRENGNDIPGSPYTVRAKGPPTSPLPLTSYVATIWHGEESADIRAITNVTSPAGDAVSHTVARKGKHVLEIRFLPTENGMYKLDFFKGRSNLEQIFHLKVDNLTGADTQIFKLSGEGLSTAFVNKPATVYINSINSSLKSFSVEFDGPGIVDIEQKRSSKTGNDCTIQYIGHVPGVYSMSIKYDGFHVEGSPYKINLFDSQDMIAYPEQSFTPSTIQNTDPVSSARLCVVSGEGLEKAFLGAAHSFQVNTAKAGNGMLMAGFHASSASTATEVSCKHLAGDLYLVQYKIEKTGLHNLSVLWNGQDIPGSPFSITVYDTNNN